MFTTNDLLVVIDMQNDFIDGALGTKEAQAITAAVAERIRRHQRSVYYTLDTHTEDYLTTQEGHYLPVAHCQKGSDGWALQDEVARALRMQNARAFEKPTFGSTALMEAARSAHAEKPWTSITLVGVCTDICVISNALLLKAALPNVPLYVDAALCAGVTPESHATALAAMETCQVAILHA